MKTYFIQTFGCQMNEADSEKIHMMLLQSGFMKVTSWEKADLVIFNTCSVRKKGEDRVYSMINEISKEVKKRKIESEKGVHKIVGITGCMVRKTGMNKKYFTTKKERDAVSKIELIKEKEGIFNHDDKLFPKLPELDFTLRIEEIRYLPFLLSSGWVPRSEPYPLWYNPYGRLEHPLNNYLQI